MSAGLIVGSLLAIHVVREAVDRQVSLKPRYLIINSTPAFSLPPATPLPTLSPTITPPPLPVIRIAIPAIELNSSVVETGPVTQNGSSSFIWESVAFAVGHYNSSGNPGSGRNIVLAGHNNTEGEVFRHLEQLRPGDEIILFTESGEFHYQVQKKFIMPYSGAEEEGNAKLQAFAAPQSTEMVTLISCWPYATNSHRIVIVAMPVSVGDPNAQ